MMTKPQPSEYAAPHAGYVQLIGDEDVFAVLNAQQQISYDLFIGLSEEQANYAYAEGKWNFKQVAGHMIDTERVFSYRLLCFSREYQELPGFDQDVYVDNSTFNNQSIQDLAEEFKLLRTANLYMIKALTATQLTKNGIASGYPVSVKALVYMIAGHERHHLNILKERYL